MSYGVFRANQLEGQISMLEAEAKRKDAQIERLRAALKPFSDLSSGYVRLADYGGWEDECILFGVVDSGRDFVIRVADCRAALTALEET